MTVKDFLIPSGKGKYLPVFIFIIAILMSGVAFYSPGLSGFAELFFLIFFGVPGLLWSAFAGAIPTYQTPVSMTIQVLNLAYFYLLMCVLVHFYNKIAK